MITTQNSGPLLASTNYWDTEHAAQGLFYLTCNANAVRLLVPDSQLESLGEMRTGRTAEIERTSLAGNEAYTVWFVDGTASPFCVQIMRQQCDRSINACDRLLVYTRNGLEIDLACRVVNPGTEYTTPPRDAFTPRQIVEDYGKRYPKCWQHVDDLRAAMPPKSWPAWCFHPTKSGITVLANAYNSTDGDAGIALGMLAAWRTSQGVFRFDSTMYESITDTPLDGDLPADVLQRLPQWCVYVETPGSLYAGFFAMLDTDDTDSMLLRLLLHRNADGAYLLVPIPIALGRLSLTESIAQFVDAYSRDMPGRTVSDGVADELVAKVAPCVSLLLYLCSVNAEMRSGDARPGRATPTKTKQGPRFFPPDKPTVWGVGERIGAAIRAAIDREQSEPASTGRAVRPHIRRAHWHKYWRGPRDGQRHTELHWLPPIPVAVEDLDALPTTITEIKK